MTGRPSRHASPHRVPGLVECELPEELLLHRPGGPVVLSLNATARAVWELCDGRRSIEAIALDLTRRFQAPAGEILVAVESVVQELADLGLIQLPSPADSPGAGPSR
jgi:hypothetical protein